MAATDARPVPRKNAAYRAYFPIRDADGDLVSAAATLDSEVSIDGGAFADAASEATEIGTSGIYFLDLTAAEMNGDGIVVQVKTGTAGAKTAVLVFYPEEAGDIRVNVTQISDDTTAADNAELAFDGTGYGFTACTMPTTTTATNVTTVNGLAANVITAASINADAITAAKIAAGAIDAATFAAGAIDAAAIATGAIDADAIAAGAITAAKFAGGAIDAAALAADAVTEIRSLVNGTSDSGTTTTMVDAARTEADTDYWKGARILFTSGTIANQCRLITAFDAATDTITFTPATTQAVATQTYEILPAARVDLHLWAGSAANALVSGRVDASVGAMATGVIAAGSFAAGAIDAAAIATGAIDADAIAADAITAAKIANAAIDAATFAAGAIDAASIATGAITAAKFAAGAIDAAAIANSAIDAATFAAGAIDAASIATGALTAAKFAAGAIDAAALAADAATEIRDSVWAQVMTEPTAVPAVTGTMKAAIEWMLVLSRNKATQTSTTFALRNDADAANIATSTVSDDGTTFTRGEFA